MRCSCHICCLPVSLSLSLSVYVLQVARELLPVNKLEFDGSQLGYNWTAHCSRIMSREKERERHREDWGMQLQFVAKQGAWHIWPHLQNYTKCTKLFAKSISCSNNNNKNCTKTDQQQDKQRGKTEERSKEGGEEKTENWNNYKKCCVVLLLVVVLRICEHTHTQVAQTNTEKTMLQHEAACQSDNLLVIANSRKGRAEGRQGKQLKTRHGQQKFS